MANGKEDPSRRDKFKNKAKEWWHKTLTERTATPSTSESSQPTPQQTPVLSPALTPEPTLSNDAHIASLPTLQGLQERLWNRAYDELKAEEPKLVAAYEKVLSAEIQQVDTNSVASKEIENIIGEARETRRLQMQQVIQRGLERTKKQASVKEGIGEGLQIVEMVKGIINSAVQASPQAAVAWAGICLGLEIISNPITESQDNRKGIAYVVSKMEWYWHLASSLLDQNTAAPSSAALRTQLEKHIMQLYKRLLLYQMRSACLYRRHWVAVLGKDLFRIDDWAGQLQEIQEAEAAVQKHIEQYNSEENKTHLREIANAANNLGDALEKHMLALTAAVEKVHSAITDQSRRQETRYREETANYCLKDLRSTGTDPRDDKTRIQREKGGLQDINDWIFDNSDFKLWHDDPEARLLWIKGDPGKGKTMLLCSIIDRLQKRAGMHLSFFFCQATDARLNNATAVLRGLVFLLVSQDKSLVRHMQERYDEAGRQLFEDKNAWEALAQILTAILEDPQSKTKILVVDALDECQEDQERLLDFIARPSPAKWIVSSRNWPQIEERLEMAKQKIRLQLELNSDSICQAVENYIDHKVHDLARLRKYSAEMRDEIQSYLLANADGTFLWVALVCKELEKPLVIRKSTDAMLKSFPKGLVPLYEQMMSQIEQLTDDDAGICKEILALASVAQRPLNWQELRLLCVSPDTLDYAELENIVKYCGSFLNLEGGIIHFVHKSAKDYLVDHARSKIFPQGVENQNYRVFSQSLHVLSDTLRRDIYNLSDPGYSIDQVAQPEPDPLAPIGYLCVYWADHLESSGNSKNIRDEGAVHVVQEFIEKKFLFWLESLSLLRSMTAGIIAVQKLKAIIETIDAQNLGELVKDAHRFILSSNQPIAMAPLQAYASALVFSPENSLIRNLFKKEEPDWMTLKPRVELDWSASLQTLEGHEEEVKCIAFSPDGKTLASGSTDSTIRLWDAVTGEHKKTLEGDMGEVKALAFSPDGTTLVSVSGSLSIQLWDAVTGAYKRKFSYENKTLAIAPSPNGETLAFGSVDGTIRLWDVATGVHRILESHTSSVLCVNFSPDGKMLASASMDSTIHLWDVATGVHRILEGHTSYIYCVHFSPDGKTLASGSNDRTIHLWDVATGVHRILESHTSSVLCVNFSPDGKMLASASMDSTIHLWDVATGVHRILEGHTSYIYCVHFSPDGKTLASSSNDRTIRLWDTTIKASTQADPKLDYNFYYITVSPNHQIAVSYDTKVYLWDTATGRLQRSLEGHTRMIYKVTFSPNSEMIASASTDTTIRLWDTTTGNCKCTLAGHTDDVTAVEFFSNGEKIASASLDASIRFWDVATGLQENILEVGHKVFHIVFSPNEENIASTSFDAAMRLCDVATGICKTAESQKTQTCAVFSPDGKTVTAISRRKHPPEERSLDFWDTTTGMHKKPLNQIPDCNRVAFSPSGETIAVDLKNTIDVWDLATGTCKRTHPKDFYITSLSISKNGNYIITNRGSLPINPSPDCTSEFHDTEGMEIFVTTEWVTRAGKNVLWLPHEYRNIRIRVCGDTIVLGSHSTKLAFIRLAKGQP